MLDLENREVLIQYLLEKGVIHSDIPYEVNYCRGGVSSMVLPSVSMRAAMQETPPRQAGRQGRLACRSRPHEDRSHRQ